MKRNTHESEAKPSDGGERPRGDDTFKRHGPEPPENDSGPSQDGDDMFRNPDTIRNVEPDEQVD